MGKFSVTKNKEHWNQYAASHKDAVEGASFDKNLVELENSFIISILKKIKPKKLLDVGCGNGQRTRIFAKYVKEKVLGIDYAEEMIKQAKSLKNNKVNFVVANTLNFNTDEKFDVIVSCRSIINQSSTQNQLKLFKKLHSMLKKNGHLIIAEASVEGLCRLNKLRRTFGLKPIDEHWFNKHICEKQVFPKIKKLFFIKKIKRLGMFYVIARVIHPAYVFPNEAPRESPLNVIGKKMQILFTDSEDVFEPYGRHLLIDFKRK